MANECGCRLQYDHSKPSSDAPGGRGAWRIVHCPLHARAEAMQTALIAIRDDPHCYEDADKPYIDEFIDGVRSGILSGHRCAANKAQAALDGSA